MFVLKLCLVFVYSIIYFDFIGSCRIQKPQRLFAEDSTFCHVTRPVAIESTFFNLFKQSCALISSWNHSWYKLPLWLSYSAKPSKAQQAYGLMLQLWERAIWEMTHLWRIFSLSSDSSFFLLTLIWLKCKWMLHTYMIFACSVCCAWHVGVNLSISVGRIKSVQHQCFPFIS